MKQYSGYKAEKATSRELLPIGGYVAKILEVKEELYDWGGLLRISFDIAEGQYKGFFKGDYQNNPNEDKKWRGVYRLYEPKDDGSEQDGWTKRTFNNAIYSVEASNPGYHWDWNEEGLKGKLIGVIFRNEEWEMNGKTGWVTKCGGLTDINDIRDNTFKQLKDKPLRSKPSSSFPTSAANNYAEVEDDDDLPF